MRIDVFTIFPEMVAGFFGQSLLGKAQDRGLLDLRAHDLRAHTSDPHRTVDDAPFGGGAGMVLMAEPVFAAVEAADPPRPLFLLSPGGRRFDSGPRSQSRGGSSVGRARVFQAHCRGFEPRSPLHHAAWKRFHSTRAAGSASTHRAALRPGVHQGLQRHPRVPAGQTPRQRDDGRHRGWQAPWET